MGEERPSWEYGETEGRERGWNELGGEGDRERPSQTYESKQSGWSGGAGVPCLLSCIHVHCLLPLREQKKQALLLPSFLFGHTLPWSTSPFPVLQLSRLLTLNILGLSSRPDAFLSLCWIFPHQIFH